MLQIVCQNNIGRRRGRNPTPHAAGTQENIQVPVQNLQQETDRLSAGNSSTSRAREPEEQQMEEI